MKHLKTINEYNTENDDHKVDQRVNINNDKKFGEETPVILPTDYYLTPDEDGEIDDEDYYTTSAGRDGLYHGVEPGHNKGTKARKTAVYKMSAESINNNLSDDELLEKYNKSISRIEKHIKKNTERLVYEIDEIYIRTYEDELKIVKGKNYEINTNKELYKKLENILEKKLVVLKKLYKIKDYNL